MRISIKKISLLAIFLVFVAILIAGKISYSQKRCNDINVEIMTKNVPQFISQQQIKTWINSEFRVLDSKCKSINLNKLEQKLRQISYIKDAQVYLTNTEGTIDVKIWFRQPIAKFYTKNQTFFVDEDGYIFPVVPKKSPYCIVINGDLNFKKKIDFKRKNNLLKIVDTNKSTVFQAFKLVKYINTDNFLRTYITEIYVSKDRIELVPRIGNFVIILGDFTDFRKKIRNLKAFLSQIKRIGWDRYSQINLSYPNQIVCSKN